MVDTKFGAETGINQNEPALAFFTLVLCLAYSSTLKMEAICSFETLNVLHGVISKKTALFITTTVRS
jgi:hypothetical protein